MKSPTNYGSENEETQFIRRVAAPDRPSNKRRQKKRLAMAGATLGLLAASAGVGYTAMKSAGSTSTAVRTANLKADMSSEARSFVSKLGDAFENPNFNKIDKNRDGELSLHEILEDLSNKEEVDVGKVKRSDLPKDIKKKIIALLKGKLKSDNDCAKQALDKREAAVTKADHEIFYYLLDVFCPRITIAVTPPDQGEEEPLDSETQQTVEIPTPNGDTAQVIILGEPADGKQTIAIPDDQGGYTTTEVRSIETPSGEQKILIPNAQGDITPVVVPEIPAEISDETEDIQVVDVVDSTGETEQVIIEGEPDHGEQKVKISNGEGGYTETEATVEETPDGEELIIEDHGEIIHVDLPGRGYYDSDRESFEEPGRGYYEPLSMPEPPALQTLDIVDEDGEHQQVVLVGGIEGGKQTVEIANEYGGFTTEEVTAVKTSEGEKLVIEDAQGQATVVEVHELPAEVAATVTEDSQVVNAVTADNKQVQIVVEGEPEHGEQTVQLIDEHGDVTVEQAKAIETSEGVKLEIETDEGPVSVVVAEVPEEIKEEAVEESMQGSKFMTKPEFREWITKHYEDRLKLLKVEEQKLEDEERAKAGRVKGLEDCIEQASNKFGYYGVYEQAPYYQNAVNWVEEECWTAQQWEPESPYEHPNLRR